MHLICIQEVAGSNSAQNIDYAEVLQGLPPSIPENTGVIY
jgi:hypothetical protein